MISRLSTVKEDMINHCQIVAFILLVSSIFLLGARIYQVLDPQKKSFLNRTLYIGEVLLLGATALIGGFLLGLARNLTLKEAARLGVAASTSAVMREAPRLCLRRDIPGLIQRVAIRDL